MDGSKIRIDVAGNGDLKINGGPDKTFGGLIDFKVATGSIDLISADGLVSSTLINSVSMTGLLTGFRATIKADTLHTEISVGVGIDDIDIDILSLGMRIENAFITGSNYFEELDGLAGGNPEDVFLTTLTANFFIDLYADDKGLHVELDQAEFDMGIGDIMMADASIGSFRLDDVNLNGLSMVISGHP